jgi:hypothetical protein
MYRRVVIPTALALAALAAPTGDAAPTFVITGDVNIGGFRRDATVKRAIEVFGLPAGRESFGYEECVLKWPAFGITMTAFYNAGRSDPCGPLGRHVRTTVTDGRWRTATGLRIGDTLRRLRALYPRAKNQGNGVWWLKTRWFGVALPTLETKIERGRVGSFTVHGPRTF